MMWPINNTIQYNGMPFQGASDLGGWVCYVRQQMGRLLDIFVVFITYYCGFLNSAC